MIYDYSAQLFRSSQKKLSRGRAAFVVRLNEDGRVGQVRLINFDIDFGSAASTGDGLSIERSGFPPGKAKG